MSESGERVTLDEVAKVSGVSTAAVSRALNGREGVSADVRERIRAVAASLGYRPNRAARSLASGRSGVLGLVLPTGLNHDDTYSGRMVHAVATAAAAHDQALMVWAGTVRPEGPVRDLLSTGLVDGIIVTAVGFGEPWIEELLDGAAAVVLVGRHPKRTEALWVGVDDAGGTAALVDHLVSTGRRRIGVITGPLERVDAADRYAAFVSAVGRHGLAFDDTLVAHGDYSIASGYAATRSLLPAEPDAIVAGNDHMAVGALRALREVAKRVPEDVAVAGFDDAAVATEVEPSLTTVRQDLDAVGRLAVEHLLRRIDGQPAPDRPLVVPSPLLVRASTGGRSPRPS